MNDINLETEILQEDNSGFVLTTEQDKDGFRQIITNPEQIPDYVSIERRSDHYLNLLMEFHRIVSLGTEGRPYCPFISPIERENGYHVKDIPYHPHEIQLDTIIPSLEEKFLSITEGLPDKKLFTKVVVGVLSHPEVSGTEYAVKINEARAKYRQHFVDNELMFAIMHPHHSLGTQSSSRIFSDEEPLYNSPAPLIMVRARHPMDSVFPKTQTEYKKFLT